MNKSIEVWKTIKNLSEYKKENKAKRKMVEISRIKIKLRNYKYN